jgi:hypothetical protein
VPAAHVLDAEHDEAPTTVENVVPVQLEHAALVVAVHWVIVY